MGGRGFFFNWGKVDEQRGEGRGEQACGDRSSRRHREGEEREGREGGERGRQREREAEKQQVRKRWEMSRDGNVGVDGMMCDISDDEYIYFLPKYV